MRQYLLAFLVLTTTFSAYANSGGGEATISPYLEITTPFVVNIQDENSMKFLQVNAQLRLSKPELRSQITKNLPAIQHIMMMVLSEQHVKEIRTVAGKQKVREQAIKELQEFLQKEVGEPAVDEILFTGFIIQ